MNGSTGRILTTHTGSLPRPPDLLRLLTDQGFGSPYDERELAARVKEAVVEAVKAQVDAGIDIVSDGEMSKPSFFGYVAERLTGFGGQAGGFALRDVVEYPGSFGGRPRTGEETPAMLRPGNDGPVSYVGRPQLETDLANLREAAGAAGATATFMPAVAPGTVVQNMPSTHYPSRSAYLYALADALAEEYRAIAEAGVTLQVDCPDLAMDRHVEFWDSSVDEFRTHIQEHVEVLNHALQGISEDRVRVHVCWGNYPGPHHLDVPLRDILDIVYEIKAGAISIEGANPRHEHEWRVFEEFPLPDGKKLIPGVIDDNSPYVEHPEVVAQRLLRYARVAGGENLIAGTDCGFGTMGTGSVVPGVVYAKLRSLAEGARLASKELFSGTEVTAP